MGLKQRVDSTLIHHLEIVERVFPLTAETRAILHERVARVTNP